MDFQHLTLAGLIFIGCFGLGMFELLYRSRDERAQKAAAARLNLRMR